MSDINPMGYRITAKGEAYLAKRRTRHCGRSGCSRSAAPEQPVLTALGNSLRLFALAFLALVGRRA